MSNCPANRSQWRSTKRRFATRGADARGFIIVAVLWILASLAALVVIYSTFMINSSVVVAGNTDRIQTQAMVTTAIELTCYQLLSMAERSRRTSGRFDIRVGGARVSASYVSESARIDLNVAPKEFIAGLMVGLGEVPDKAVSSAERIVAWRRPISTFADSDPENSDYRAAGVPYLPRHGAFPHIGELWLVHGLSSSLVERMLPFVTVLNGKPAINIRDAAPQVIAALPHMTPDRLQNILNERRNLETDPRTLLSLAAPDGDLVTIEGSRSVRINIRIEFDTLRQASSEVVILLPEADSEPYRLLSRSDNIEIAHGGRQAGLR